MCNPDECPDGLILVIVRAHRHHRDASAQLIEDGELAQAPRDELELFAVFASDCRLNRVLIEQEVLKARVEQQSDGDSLLRGGAEQRQSGPESDGCHHPCGGPTAAALGQ